jgi:hypothetical protein
LKKSNNLSSEIQYYVNGVLLFNINNDGRLFFSASPNRIFEKWSTKKIASCNLFENVRALGIDEIALKKGHKDFVFILVNLETTEVINILEDRTKAFLINYFKSSGKNFYEHIEIFSSDYGKDILIQLRKYFLMQIL